MTQTNQLARTPLYDWHVAHGARMVDFFGWAMPVQYTSIVEEHLATRSAVGLFDISHMGRLTIAGADAERLVDWLVTRRVADMRPRQIRYALMCNEQGGILDDLLVTRDVLENPQSFGLVVNASNRAKILDWLAGRQAAWSSLHGTPADAVVGDRTTDTAMFAVQGPRAIELVDSLTQCSLAGLKRYHEMDAQVDGRPCYLSRTGYTGEDGCEVICSAEDALPIWSLIAKVGEPLGLRLAGLGARDTLRLEAAMPLYGHELSEQINPLQAGLGFAVSFGDRDFVGREALEQFAQDKTQPVRIGMQLDDKRVPRESCLILHSNRPVGEVTSGTFSPTLDRPIAMGYVEPSAAEPGTTLQIDIRGRQHAATVVPLPFYQRGK